MKYLSLFSGIEAASVAWKPLGWECVGVSEIDPFACAVLKHRFPNVPNLGDISKITEEQIDELKRKHGSIRIVVGGSPCQSFSVAGARKGLEDPRGNLMYQYIRIVKAVSPQWFVWENVPGVFSSNEGKDFATLLQAMDEFGYSLCWRTLDAQFFGVPQRRRRVFLIGHLGEGCGGFNTLFERKSLRRNTQERAEKRKDYTSETQDSFRSNDSNAEIEGQSKIECDSFYESSFGGFTHDVKAGTLKAVGGALGGGSETLTVHNDVYRKITRPHFKGDSETWDVAHVSNTLNTFDTSLVRSTHAVLDHQLSPPLCARDYKSVGVDGITKDSQPCVAEETIYQDKKVIKRVRRLTPLECERLQGFPDGWTQIPYRGKKSKDCSKTNRYKALGNSMAVPVMHWIGEGIMMTEGLNIPTKSPTVKKKLMRCGA